MSSVSRETSDRLTAFGELVKKWNPRINLIARSTINDISHRHIDDSAQLVHLVDLHQGVWVDLGSGGGFPGLVAAILGADKRIEYHLVESDQRKATFLRTCIRELNLNRIQVHTTRIESLKPLSADIVTARALAPLPLLMSYVYRHIKPGGAAWLMKGEDWQNEVRQAQATWKFFHKAFESQTHENAAILRISDISHA